MYTNQNETPEIEYNILISLVRTNDKHVVYEPKPKSFKSLVSAFLYVLVKLDLLNRCKCVLRSYNFNFWFFRISQKLKYSTL